ncbi:unnamed protein product [Tilletia controversa]|uniref:Pseudouridine synthase I TruA alpha/beta domain-containing protein n=1 Tax=Tilletia caries TaxID=13290 RepID=A0ABN7ILL5_9BASI|nr:unnamed protein product [Tilletia caries]CAD6962900.1 unnamed protein product [Tilletia controversa]CAD7064027.1 unnamed protein product [Tilletia caries]
MTDDSSALKRTNGDLDDEAIRTAPTTTHDEPDPKPAAKRVKLDGRGNVLPHNYRQNHNKGANFNADRADFAVEGRDDAGKRLPKRKVAVFFGYCGIGYNGLQINPGVKTIEGDIFDAFCKVGAVSKDNAVNPAKVALQRSARTDRGVHAAGNVLTLKLILNAPGVPEILAAAAASSSSSTAAPSVQAEGATSTATSATATGGEVEKKDPLPTPTPTNAADSLVQAVNAILPPIIRLWGITRVQGKFNARTSCDSRQYEYLLPTYVFLPPKPGTYMYGTLSRLRELSLAAGADPTEPAGRGLPSWNDVLEHPFWAAQGVEKQFGDDMVEKKKWRIPGAQLERTRTIFQQYAGSHNFHNFTISDPKLINGTEWVSIKFHGQSFMLHQIRKMIGLLVLIARTPTPASLIAETYGPARIHVPKAPGLGLLLEQPLFGSYNAKVVQANNRVAAVARNKGKAAKPKAKKSGGRDEEDGDEDEDGEEGDQMREAVHFDKFTKEMEAFKQTYVYDRIMNVEEETCEFGKWLNYLDVFTGSDFDFLNPKGSIPTHCILKVGELRRPPGGQLKGIVGDKAAAGAAAAGGDAAGEGGHGAQNGGGSNEDAAGESDDEEMTGVNAAELEG